MSLLKAIKAQLGLSNTPANNFTITAEADNGTLKLARGNAGATTQDILTVDVNGNVLVDGNNINLFSAKSFAASGYQKLPSGLIIQWGSVGGYNVGSVVGDTTNWSGSFPIAFPNACFSVTLNGGEVVGTGEGHEHTYTPIAWTNSMLTVRLMRIYGSSSGPSDVFNVRFIAIGR